MLGRRVSSTEREKEKERSVSPGAAKTKQTRGSEDSTVGRQALTDREQLMN